MSLGVAGLSWSAGGRAIVADVSFTAGQGAITGIVGPNGSGKSTLLRLISGVLRADAGSVRWGDANLLTLPRRDRARLLALVEQSAHAEVALTAVEAVTLGRLPHRGIFASATTDDETRALAALTRVGAVDLAERQISTLSGGELQRVHLARALTQEPEVILLDEPTNHLDVAAALTTMDLLRELAADGATVIVVLHDLNLAARYCDELVLLAEGKVAAAGNPSTVLTPEKLDPIYGVHTRVIADPETGAPLLVFG